MQFLWWQHGINLKLSIYDVAATGYMSGFIQIVPSSTTIGAIHATAGGTSTDNTVIKYLKGVFVCLCVCVSVCFCNVSVLRVDVSFILAEPPLIQRLSFLIHTVFLPN